MDSNYHLATITLFYPLKDLQGGVKLANFLNNFLRRCILAKIHHVKSVVLRQELNYIFADIVNIPVNGGNYKVAFIGIFSPWQLSRFQISFLFWAEKPRRRTIICFA